jgi:6-pyruvoyl-tetrahydropterin synthase
MPELSITTKIKACHNWPGAPDHRSYLRYLHGHEFVVTAYFQVKELDRELEFHDLKADLDHQLGLMTRPHDDKKIGLPPKTFGTRSCEHIASELVQRMPRLVRVWVAEDGEFGAEVKRHELDRPPVITVCGSTRFKDETQRVIADLELQGWAVLSVGSYMHAEGITFSDQVKRSLDHLHKRKIAMSDAIYVVNVDGYVGDSTRGEIELAKSLGKPVIYLEAE